LSNSPLVIFAEGPVGIIELARPTKFNALSRLCFERMRVAMREFEADDSIRVVHLRAQGKNFCTGADLEEIGSITFDATSAGANATLTNEVFRQLETSRLPVVAAVQGLCLAGGLELMLACDVVFAAASARIGDQHARYGLIPGSGGSQRLPRIIGLRRALDLLFSARWIDAPTAESWGLVNRVLPDDRLHAEALEYCTVLAKRNARSIAIMKRLSREGLERTLDEGLAAEASEVPAVFASAGVQEGLAAFRERREPKFP
jgi:enoyl-CoA hydratase